MTPEEMIQKILELENRIKGFEMKDQTFNDQTQLRYPLDTESQRVLKESVKREILDILWDDVYYYATMFDSLDGWDADSATLSEFGSYGHIGLGVTVSSGASAGTSESVKKIPTIQGFLSFDNHSRLRTKVTYFDDNNQESYVGVGLNSASTDHYGFFQDDTTLYGSTGDGSAETTVFLKTVDSSGVYELEARHFPGEKVDFYVDGVLKGSIAKTLPSGSISDSRFIHVGCTKPSTEAAKKIIYLSHIEYIQELER